jgi:hypothetical protein
LYIVAPSGVIDEWLSEEEVIVYVLTAKYTTMVWLADIFVKVYGLTIATDALSTIKEETEYPVCGVKLYAWSEPQMTLVTPEGVIEPPAPALEVIG